MPALKRFFVRRNKPVELVSDCTINFRDVIKALREFYDSVSSSNENESMKKYVDNEDIIWKFNPPSTLHYLGLCDVNIKSLKYHQRRTMGNSIFKFEEFHTLLSQMETCLSSRSLCQLSYNQGYLKYLTQGHFLTGADFTVNRELDIFEIPPSRLVVLHIGHSNTSRSD